MLTTVIVFIIILTILVLIHELGHFLVARWIGVHVEEFGLGLPPRLFGKQIGKTVYSINWLPVGGFVKLAGEDDDEKKVSGDVKQYFWARSKKERSAILIAGVTMNFLMAIILTAFLLTTGVNEPSGKVHIEKISSGSPAEISGMQVGDEIRSVLAGSELVEVHVPKDLIDTVKRYRGDTVMILVLRAGEERNIQVIPRSNPPAGEGPLGVAISDLELRKYPFSQAPGKAVSITLERTWLMGSSLVGTLAGLIRFGQAPADVAGPIGIAQVTGQAVKIGWQAVIEFMSILSLNLAVLNILPIPALDGGRLAFVFLEKILGRKVKPAFEKQTHQIGMIILLLLVLLVSIGDIMRLTRGG